MSSLKESVTRQRPLPPKIVLYGTPGIGKSTFAASAPNPLFFNIEDGLGSIDVDQLKVNDFYDFMGKLALFYKEDHDYKTLVIDSIDWLEGLIFEQVCDGQNALNPHKKIKNIEDIGYGKGYIYAIEHWERFLNALTQIRDHKQTNIILLAHNHIKRYDDPLRESYDRHSLKLHQKAAAIVMEWSDCLFFADKKVYILKEEVGFKKQINRAKSDNERILHTEESAAFLAKNRYSLPEEIPFVWSEVEILIPSINK